MKSEQQYIELYEQHAQLIKSHAPALMNAVRDKAYADFCAQGLPSRKVEQYR